MGKRPRTQMKRTTSMKELSPDLSSSVDLSQDGKMPPLPAPKRGSKRRFLGESSEEMVAPFLKFCGLCKRGLGPGFDTFMYRGEVAFCSNECREKQIIIDEKKARKMFSSSSSSTNVEKSNPLPPPKEF